MKTTVVPAQITTVEDKIAGALTLPQIVLLVIPMVFGALIYASILPKMHFNSIKMAILMTEFIFFGGMAVRINGKILGDWLIIFLRYSLRPRRYISTKEDLIHREIALDNEKQIIVSEKKPLKKEFKAKDPLSLKEELSIEKIFDNDELSVSIKPSKKGGLSVSFKPIKN